MIIHKPVSPTSRGITRLSQSVASSSTLGGGAVPAGAFLMLETGDYLLLENSKMVLSESGITSQPITSGPDDGDYDDGGGFDNTANDIDLGNDAGTAKKGYFYFASTGIPQGSEIVTAYLRVTSADNLADATVNLKFVGSDEDGAAVPANKPDAASRPRTTAVTYWNDVGAWVVDVQYDSPSIKGIIQEIVDREGFAGPILIFVEDNGSTVASKRKVKSYNGNPADAAELVVTYWPTTPTPPTPPSGPPKNFDSTTRTVLITDSGTNDWIGRPGLLDDGSKWIMVYLADTHHTVTAAARIHIRFSENEGESWTAEDTFTDGGGVTGFPLSPQLGGKIDSPLIMQAANDDLLILVPEVDVGVDMYGTRQYRSSDGGDSWSDEGVVTGDETCLYMDWVSINSDLYVLGYYDASGDVTAPFNVVLYKSTDNGASWNKVSDVTATGDACNESALAHTGSGRLVVVLRDDNEAKTYERISTDYGATWGNLHDATNQLDVLQRPHLCQFDDGYDRLYLIGRDVVGSAPAGYTIAYFSDDGGITWNGGCRVGAYYADTGYADMLQRADGDLYLVTYEGTLNDADLVEYIVEMS